MVETNLIYQMGGKEDNVNKFNIISHSMTTLKSSLQQIFKEDDATYNEILTSLSVKLKQLGLGNEMANEFVDETIGALIRSKQQSSEIKSNLLEQLDGESREVIVRLNTNTPEIKLESDITASTEANGGDDDDSGVNYVIIEEEDSPLSDDDIESNNSNELLLAQYDLPPFPMV